MFKQYARVEDICIGNIIVYDIHCYYKIEKKKFYNTNVSYYRLYLKLIHSPRRADLPRLRVEHHKNTELLVVADNINQIKWIDV